MDADLSSEAFVSVPMEGVSLRSVYEIIAFREDADGDTQVLVDWNERMLLEGEVVYAPLEWIPLQRMRFQESQHLTYFQKRARRAQALFGPSDRIQKAWSKDTYGWSVDDDRKWREAYAGNLPATVDESQAGEAAKRGVEALTERWWVGLQADAEEVEEEVAGQEKRGKSKVVYKRARGDDAGFVVGHETPKAARSEQNDATPAPTPGIFAALSQRLEVERQAVGETDKRARAWGRVFEGAKEDPAFNYLKHFEPRWTEQRGPHVVCRNCDVGVISIQGVEWEEQTGSWMNKPKWGNAFRHHSRDHAASVQTRRVRQEEDLGAQLVPRTTSASRPAPARRQGGPAWVDAHLDALGRADLSLSDVPPAHMDFLFAQLKPNLQLYLLDKHLCHQVQRYQSQDGIQRFTSVLANGFGVYWESEWLKAHTRVIVERKKVEPGVDVVYDVRLALACSDLATTQTHLLVLLERCVQMESAVHASRWNGATVVLQTPPPPDWNVVSKTLGANAARKGQLVDSETCTDKVLHHVEFMSYLLVRGVQANVGLPFQMLETQIQMLQQEAKRHRNGLRKQTLSFRHQAFVQNASQVLLVYQTMHENHAAHLEFFAQVNEALAASLSGTEASTLRQALYQSQPFVEYLLEAFMTMTLLEHGVQRTQVYRELVLLSEVMRDASIAHLSGKILSGVLEEKGGCFSMLIAADKIQNAGVLKLPYSWQGAVIMSVLVDYVTFLSRSNAAVAEVSRPLSRADRLNDLLEQVEDPDEDDDSDAQLLFHEEDQEDEQEEEEEEQPAAGAKSLADMLPRMLVQLDQEERYVAISNHATLFQLYARGVEMTTVSELPADMEELETLLSTRQRRQVLPGPLANHRVLRSWSEEYLSLVTLRQDPTFLADSSMMRRHSFSTVRSTYAPAHEEAASAELVRRQGLLMGKQPSDYPVTELDCAVMWHVEFLKRVGRPVRPSTQQAIRVLSQQRFAQQHDEQRPLLWFSSLRDDVLTQFDVLLRRQGRAHVPVPTMVGSIVCVSQMGLFDVPYCDGCRLPMLVASLVDAATADGSTLQLSNSHVLPMPAKEAQTIVLCVDALEIDAILYCTGHNDACQRNIALLTCNSIHTSAVFTEESREEMFKRK